MKDLCQFDTQIQCEEFYTQENCFTPEELGLVEEATVVSFTPAQETMDKIEKYQLLFDDAESYLLQQVDCDDIDEHNRVLDILIAYQEILDDLKSFSWVAEYFVDEKPRARYYKCGVNCPCTKGEEDVNGCTGECALCKLFDIL